MNLVRVAISLLVLLVVAISVVGWIWTGSHQPAAQSMASRVVLSLAILAGLIGLAAIWRTKRT
ncbi:MAG TPA: hypothetical protein VH436_33340 [Vicinamibacterales bacterium]|jgi:hypothetical protein